MQEVNLGDKVKCNITGFEGIAISIHEYLHGCRRVTVQPKLTTTGTFEDERTFDEPQLIVLDSAKQHLRQVNNTGGPDKFVPPAKSTGR